jgi:hypothetical protein
MARDQNGTGLLASNWKRDRKDNGAAASIQYKTS